VNNEHAKGAADTFAGKVKEVAGHVSGDKKLEAAGKADQIKGAAHNTAGDAKDVGKEAVRNVKQ
jgi:uncharacterized protein YjbJ (UPF0337 family)